MRLLLPSFGLFVMFDPVGEELYYAAREGRASEVSALLRDYPEINVNFTSNQWTALHTSTYGGQAEVVKLLLARPDINVNLKNYEGQTSLRKVLVSMSH